jgi:LacI family transcriptional regulator
VPARIEDVARAAGVSIKTVSRVINGEAHVRPVLRERVLASIAALHYSPNIAARRLASNSAFSIGLLFGGAPGEYFPQIILSILTHGMERGYTLLVANFTPFDVQSRVDVGNLVTRRHADGLILTPPCDIDTVLLDQLSAASVPFVRLTPADPSSPLPYVAADDRRGAFEMTEYLISRGHRRIGFLYGDVKHHASNERYQGFLEAHRAHGLRCDPRLKRVANFRFDRGVRLSRELLMLEPRPTAIFASNDESAAGALMAAHELGIKVPDELSIAGFDDFPSAQKTYPPLTTVRQPMDEISRLATQLLIDLIEKRKPPELHILVPTSQVIRGTVGNCP